MSKTRELTTEDVTEIKLTQLSTRAYLKPLDIIGIHVMVQKPNGANVVELYIKLYA